MSIPVIRMRKLTLSIFSFAAFASCSNTHTVTLAVKNSAGNIYCSLPIDNSATVFANDTLRVVSADTTFILNLNTNTMMDAFLFGGGLNNSRVQTVLGEGFSIVADPHDSTGTIYFFGKNAAGRDLYNRLSQEKNSYRYGWVRDFSGAPLDTSAVVMRANFGRIAEAEIARFDSLRRRGEIDRRFFNFVKADIELYYRTVLAQVIAAKYMQDSVLFGDYGQVWEQIYREQPISAELFNYSNAKVFTDIYLNQYIPYKTRIADKPRNFGEYINFCARNIDENISDPEARKRYLMCWLFYLSLNNKTYERTVAEQTDKFAAEFPGSEINAFFSDRKRAVEKYHEIVAADFSPEMKFVDNYRDIKSFGELLGKFKGRRVFIDLWFATCGPCLQEFRHTGALKAFLKENDIDMLYISIDRPDMEKAWQNAIKFNDLEGFHVRTATELHVDLYEKYGVVSFPTYMIVNEKGEIVERNAPNPSSGQILIDRIREKLAL